MKRLNLSLNHILYLGVTTIINRPNSLHYYKTMKHQICTDALSMKYLNGTFESLGHFCSQFCSFPGWKILGYWGGQVQPQLPRRLLTRDFSWVDVIVLTSANCHFTVKSGGCLLSMLEIVNLLHFQPGAHQVFLRNPDGLSQPCKPSHCWETHSLTGVWSCSRLPRLNCEQFLVLSSPWQRPPPHPRASIAWLGFAYVVQYTMYIEV